MSRTITAIIPTYNVAAHLATAITSVLDQTRSVSQILVVDDCSSDGTTAVAQTFRDPRIQILSSEKNSGSAVARNIGLRAAVGDLIAMLDGDDYWLPDHLAVVAGLLDAHPSSVLAFSPTEAFGTQRWIWPIRIPTDEPVHCFWECFERTIVPHMNVVMKRDAVLRIGGYREDLKQSQDYDLFLRLSHRNPFVCTRKITTHYRRHEGSITLRKPENSMHCMYRARALFFEELSRTAPEQEARDFANACIDLWETALEACVIRHNWRLMDFHLAQAMHVPGSDAVLLGWKLRRAAGTLQWIWDVANRPLRRAS